MVTNTNPLASRIASFVEPVFQEAMTPDITTPKGDRLVDPDTKLAGDLAQIDAANSDPNALALFNLSRERENGLTKDNQIANDYDNLSAIDFQNRYGVEIYQKMVANRIGGQEVKKLVQKDRSILEQMRDIGVDVASGAIQGAGGVVTLGLSALNDKAAVKSAETFGAIKGFTDSLQSDELNDRRYVDALRATLDSIDNNDLREKEAQNVGPMTAALRSIGRGVLDGAVRLTEDPVMLETGVSEGVGSLLLTGPMGRAAQAVGVAEKAAIPLAIGIQEAGGAFTGSAQEIMAMTPEELLQSPKYSELLQQGYSPEDAKIEMAARAGNVSSAIAGPLGAAAGKLVSKFEGAPFTRVPGAEVAGNMIREFAEEGLQSATGELAGNIGAVASGADPDQDLVEGVGDAAIQGAIFGAGTPLVTQGAPAALSNTLKAAGIALKYPVKKLLERGAEQLAKNEAASSVSAEQLTPVVQAAAENVPVVAEGLRTMANENNVKGEEVDAYIARVEQASQTTEEDLRGLPLDLLNKVGQKSSELGRMPNRFETMQIMAQVATDETTEPTERAAAGAFILKSSVNNRKLFTEDLPAFLDNIPHERPEFEAFAAYHTAIDSIAANPEVLKAVQWAQDKMSMPEQDLSAVDLNSPEGQSIVNTAVDVATVAPQAVNSNIANQILLQADEGTLSLTPERRRILRSAISMLNSARVFAAQNRAPEAIDLENLETELSETVGRDELMSFVGRQIETEGGAKAHQLSVRDHTASINQAVAAGDQKLAKRRAQRLGMFARSHRNKVIALNASIANGDGKNVPYDALGADDVFYTEKKGVGVRVGNAGSERFARKVYAEAVAIAQHANDIAREFPEFGIREVQVPALSLVQGEDRGSPEPVVSAEPTGATTPQPVQNEEQIELPLPPSQPTRDPNVAAPAVEPVVEKSTDLVEDTQVVEDKVAEPVQEPVSNPVAELAPVEEVAAETIPDQAQPEETAAQDPGPVLSDKDVIDLLEQTESVGPQLTVAETFPLLVQPAGRNWFHEAFKFPQTAKSRMLGLREPLRDFYRMFGGSDQLTSFLAGKELGYEVNGDDAANFRKLLVVGNNALTHMKQRLSDKVTKDKLLEKLEAGEEITRFRDLRVLNLLEKTEDGYRYNPELIETAIIAGLDWALNAADRSAPLSRQDVASLLGLEAGDVTEDHVARFNRGISLDVAKRGLAETIRKFWGVEVNKNAKEDFAKGIPEAVAAEILHGLQAAGLIELGMEKFPFLSEKTFGRVWFDTRSDEISNLVTSLDATHDFLADLAMVDKEIEGYSIGEPITQIDETQLRGSMVKLSKQQKTALESVQSTPYLPNHVVFDFVSALGEENLVSLMSGHAYKQGDLDKDHVKAGMNKGHWESVKGLQRQWVNSFRNINKQMAAVKRHGENAATYYKHHVNKLGRLQMGGLSNPQADKLAREIFMSTKSTLDMTSEDGFLKFMATVGQGIGLKTEKETRFEIAKKVASSMFAADGELRPLVLELKNWLRNKGPVPASTVSLLGQAKLSMHGLHSALAVARYEIARDLGQDLTAFETFNYLEADGKTNGPINSLMLMAVGRITPDWLKQIGKGGVFFGRNGKTLNSHEDKVDLYEDTSLFTQDEVKALGQDIANSSPEAFEIFKSFNKFLAALDTNVDIDGNGEITIKRGLTKNPLTITIYGSGVNGIAGKVADELINVLYEKLTESISKGLPVGQLIYDDNAGSEFINDLSTLTSQKVLHSRKNGKFYIDGEVRKVSGNAGDFSLSREQYETLRSNVRTFLVNPMREAINTKVSTHVGQTTSAIQQVTQLQSIVLKGMFIQEITSRLALMKADPEKYDYKNGEFLSQAELEEIRNNLLPFSPIINTGTQGYFLSGGETSNLFEKTKINGVEVSMPESFSRSLTSDLSIPATVYGPTLAGVGAIPTMVVGSGDGQMMLNYLSENPKAAARVLHVFDGLNMPADAIEEYSRGINEAVFKTWTSNTNPVRAVADSFTEFLRAGPMDLLFPGGELNDQQKQALLEISQAKAGKFDNLSSDELLNPSEAAAYLQEVFGQIVAVADETDVRRQLYAEFMLSVDQMASAESPYTNEGTIEISEDWDLDDLAYLMEDRRLELMDELAKAKADATAVEQETAQINEAVSQFGSLDETGARVLQSKELPALFKGLSSMLNPTQKEMMRNAVRLLDGSGYQLVVGRPSQLRDWEQVYNADRFIPDEKDFFGKVDPISKIILVPNQSAETIVHELIHAATFDKINAFYMDPTLLTKEERDAIERIEGLMDEWLSQEMWHENAAGYDARVAAETAINRRKEAGRDAEALNEFMAWVLANQHLSEVASKIKVKNPIRRIVGEALAALKSLIWGGPNKGPRVGDSLLSNLRFNTRVLMAVPTRVELMQQDFREVALYQSKTFGNNDRLAQLRQRFSNKIISWINEGASDPVIKVGRSQQRQNEADDALVAAQDIGKVFAFHFPGLNSMQAYSTFTTIQQALMTEVGLNTNALTRVEELYTHVIKELNVEDFRENQDPNDLQDKAWAQDKLNALEGAFITKTDKHGRSSLMSSFLALAMTDNQFRKILSNMERPASEKGDDRSLDTLLENTATSLMDRMSIRLAGEKGDNIQEALDSLVVSMIENVGDQRSFIEQRTESGFDKVEARLASAIQAGSDKVLQKTSAVLKSNASAPVRLTAGLANLAATAINESASEEAALGITQWFARRDDFKSVKELLNDFVGRTRENFPIFDMISKVRAEVQQTRQQFRDELPRKLASMFKTPVSENQWSAMFKVLGKTDLAALAGRYGIAGAIELTSNSTRLNSEITSLERSIQSQDPKRFADLKAKSVQLARYMMTGEQGLKLLRNAEAIARLLGEPNASGIASTPSAKLVDDIDHLVTLYAIQSLDEDSRRIVSELGKVEREGIEFVTNYLVGQRVDELAKAKATTIALFNHYKGHIPSEARQGGSLIVAADADHAKLVSRGYTQLSPYTGSSADRVLGKRSYYFAPVSGTAPFSQGVLQTVHQTASGIDPETGYTVGEVLAGRIDDLQIVRLIERQLSNQKTTNENLLPVFDNSGKVIAYERAADPAKLVQLNRSQDLSAMIGVWRGRQVEEMLAQKVNEQLVDNLYAIYQEGVKERRTNEFVNIANLKSGTDDPVLIEAAKLIPNQSREYIKSVFGPDEFWVRRDMLLDTFGARQASVGDLFTGKTRWNPKAIKQIEQALIGMPFLGNKAYSILVGAEKNIQEFVGNAKTIIVVKSVIVPAANMVSNIFQLLNRGVPLRSVIQGIGAKTAEINFYIKARNREIGLEADLRAAKGKNDLAAIRKLENQIKSLHDSYRRMSIWPLIEAGEFSAISSGQVTAEDLALAEGKWTGWLERKIDGLPDGLRTPARYALVTRDTALFQGLARSVQYGDFVAKAILYDDLVKRKAKGRVEAVATVNEAFVNYNRLTGRSRQYLESVGLLWFYNYKLRIMKEAVHMLRHNPLRSLMMIAAPSLPVIGNIGSPVTDNFVAILNDGKLDYSIGPSMGLHSFSLNPWLNVAR